MSEYPQQRVRVFRIAPGDDEILLESGSVIREVHWGEDGAASMLVRIPVYTEKDGETKGRTVQIGDRRKVLTEPGADGFRRRSTGGRYSYPPPEESP